MNKFIPRTTAPSYTDPHWISTKRGGLNECIMIDKQSGSCLPNCVGYAWGRMYELLGKRPNLARTDARTWYTSREGYSRGQVPALGAVACWGGTKHGHVAIVESIGPDYIMVSQSNYGGSRFEYKKAVKKPGGGYITSGGIRDFQGFIYCPKKFESSGTGSKPISPYKSVDDIAMAIIRGTGVWYHCYGEARRKKVESYGFDYNTVQRRVNELIRRKR